MGNWVIVNNEGHGLRVACATLDENTYLGGICVMH